jgi:hypothetical protein
MQCPSLLSEFNKWNGPTDFSKHPENKLLLKYTEGHELPEEGRAGGHGEPTARAILQLLAATALERCDIHSYSAGFYLPSVRSSKMRKRSQQKLITATVLVTSRQQMKNKLSRLFNNDTVRAAPRLER